VDKAAGSVLVAALLLAAGATRGEPPPQAPLQSSQDAGQPPRDAEPARLAARGLLIAIASAGQRLVAVGDRGIIVLSDDRGASWRQADHVPSQALLTGVCFLDSAHGVAVGHDELILTTEDAGRNWKRAHYAPQAQRPLLDVWCGAGATAIAVGAYSAYFTSADRGASWREVKFMPAAMPAPRARHGTAAADAAAPSVAAASAEAAGGGFHLNRIVSGADRRLYIAGEAGHLYASDDWGASWRTLPSPYEGSLFGVLPLPDQGLLAFGLRGHLYRSADAGTSWQPIETGTVAMLTGAAPLGGRDIALVGLSGVVLVSHDDGRSFTLLQQADHAGLSALASVGGEKLAVVGEGGAKLISLSIETGARSTVP
jgi:photosystem II stability/assembly factor-like uncharacterized protein